MIFNFETDGIWIADIEGNDKLSKDKQVRIAWHLPTPPQKERIMKGQTTINEDGNTEIRLDVDVKLMLEYTIDKVENVEFNKKKIETGKDLALVPLYGITDNFCLFMIKKMRLGTDLKN